MIKDLPIDLIRASQCVLESESPDECISCGAVVGTCIHTNRSIAEDVLSATEVPDKDEEPEELSGKEEQIIINPVYQVDRGMRNRF
jgi:hypothetical protein